MCILLFVCLFVCSTGIKNRIQISQATKDILTLAGKEHWTSPRPDPVQAKGKGAMDTYWLTPTSKKRKISQEESTSSETSATSATSHDFQSTVSLARVPSLTIKQDRLVDWMVDMFSEVFKKIVAQRKMATVLHKVVYKPKPGSVPLDDVTEVIVLPRYNRKTCAQSLDYRNIDLGPKVLSQLRAYVAAIASTYHNHPFHCFEHAAHGMSDECVY